MWFNINTNPAFLWRYQRFLRKFYRTNSNMKTKEPRRHLAILLHLFIGFWFYFLLLFLVLFEEVMNQPHLFCGLLVFLLCFLLCSLVSYCQLSVDRSMLSGRLQYFFVNSCCGEKFSGFILCVLIQAVWENQINSCSVVIYSNTKFHQASIHKTITETHNQVAPQLAILIQITNFMNNSL